MKPARPWIAAREAAERLGVQVPTILERCRDGRMPGAFQVFTRWRVDEATLEAWRRQNGDPNALPADHFSVDPLPFGDAAEKGEGDAA